MEVLRGLELYRHAVQRLDTVKHRSKNASSNCHNQHSTIFAILSVEPLSNTPSKATKRGWTVAQSIPRCIELNHDVLAKGDVVIKVVGREDCHGAIILHRFGLALGRLLQLSCLQFHIPR